MTRLYTGKGDDGTTGLLYGGRVSKADPATEAYGTIAGAPPSYRRTTTITTNPGGVTGARVDVTVFYRPVTGRGVLTTERSVSLSIFLANR